MNKNLYMFLFVLISSIATFSATLFAMDPKSKTENLQKHRFEKMFSEDKITYFQSKQVAPRLKAQLDHLFCKPEVKAALGMLYDHYKNDDNAKEEAKNALLAHGFIFLNEESHVYTHILFPKFIFKHSHSPTNEHLHADRVRYAQELQEKTLCTCIPQEIRIQCPHKQTYMPYLDEEKPLPLVIVVADLIDISRLRSLSRTQFNALRVAGFCDTRPPWALKGHMHNAGAKGDNIIVFDTEPLGVNLHYLKSNAPKSPKSNLITFQTIAASWLCAASWVAWKLFKS